MKSVTDLGRFRRWAVVASLITTLAASYFVTVVILGFPRHPTDVQTFGSLRIYANYGGVGHERVIIAFLFVLSAGSSWVMNGVFRKITIIGLALIVIEHALWAIGSAQVYSLAEAETPKQPYYLRGATFWDASVFVVAVIFFLAFVSAEVTRRIPELDDRK